tara:strand:+ start:388 stop:750 length:363 start_codon:yes stop_codon:yes gene_type:complete
MSKTELKVNGSIEKILPVQSGTSKNDTEWMKIQFLLRTSDEYNNLYCFEIFGVDKVEEFKKYKKEGQKVEVKFNVQTNEWKDKYFTSLSAWSVFGLNNENDKQELEQITEILETEDDLPF